MLLLKGLRATLVMFTFAFIANAGELEIEQCQELRGFLNSKLGDIDCLDQYHHFNSSGSRNFYTTQNSLTKRQVRISTFNVYQAGSTRTEFKDYELMAKMINHWDVIGTTELVNVIGIDKRHNEAVTNHYKKLLQHYRELVKTKAPKKEQSKVLSKISLLKKQYELPGYVKILTELQKLDPSWSLLLSGNTEGTKTATIRELSGYFYRSSSVKPVINEYCKKYYKFSKAYGCYPKFNKETYGHDVADLFARRPFIGSFKSGNFDFTLVTTHVVFNAPSDENLRKRIIKAAFGVDHYTEIGEGVTSRTYARFAEMTHILNFMRNYKMSFKENDLILLGDFNLEAKNPYWKTLFDENPGMEIKIEGATSLSQSKTLSDGSSTHGTSNNYDHFVLDTKITSQCAGKKNAKVFNFLENSFRKLIDKKYLVRTDNAYVHPDTGLDMFYLDQKGKNKALKITEKIVKRLKSKYTVRRGEIVPRFDLEKKAEDVVRKLIEPQLFERSYYRYFQETISDHLPVFMNCSNQQDDD